MNDPNDALPTTAPTPEGAHPSRFHTKPQHNDTTGHADASGGVAPIPVPGPNLPNLPNLPSSGDASGPPAAASATGGASSEGVHIPEDVHVTEEQVDPPSKKRKRH